MSTPIDNNTPVKLVYNSDASDERIVVSFPQGLKGAPNFGPQYKMLEESLKMMGIPIPIANKSDYPELNVTTNRQAIYLQDASFGKAFYEIHFKTKMNPDKFKWKKI